MEECAPRHATCVPVRRAAAKPPPGGARSTLPAHPNREARAEDWKGRTPQPQKAPAGGAPPAPGTPECSGPCCMLHACTAARSWAGGRARGVGHGWMAPRRVPGVVERVEQSKLWSSTAGKCSHRFQGRDGGLQAVHLLEDASEVFSVDKDLARARQRVKPNQRHGQPKMGKARCCKKHQAEVGPRQIIDVKAQFCPG